MKTMNKLPLVVATFAVLATSAARADDPRQQNRIDAQRPQEPRTTTVAVYAGERGVGQRDAARDNGSDTHFEWRHNGSGGYGAYVQGH